MNSGITLPFWLFILLALFAAIAVADRIFAPSVRWFFRRRLNKGIDELNERLHLRIQPFKLTRRQTLIDQMMYDPHVLEAVGAEAKASGTPRAVVMRKAERYAAEIVPSFSAAAYFGFGTKVARWMSEFAYRVRLGYSDDDAIRAVDPNASVVFVMNHRSNMDYVLVTYMASTRASLSYAVGEWARIFLLQSLIRAMGAYFIRRNSGDELYRKVLGAYVRMATLQGVTQAMFPEGGLTRDGALKPPKLGLLGYMVAEFDPAHQPDIVFIPVGLNYDRVLEDRILTSRAEKDETGRSFRVAMPSILGFLGNLVKLRFQGRLYRYGHACVSFGNPLSLKRWQAERGHAFHNVSKDDRFAATQALAEDLIAAIGKTVPALPVPLAATAFLQSEGKWISELELKSRIFALIAQLEANGAHVHIPRADRDYSVSAGLRMLTLRHMVETSDDSLYRANPRERILLEYYANSIAHLL